MTTLNVFARAVAVAFTLSMPAAWSDAQTSTPPPYPPSPVIAGVTFDWSTDQPYAKGSDQWPMTWGGDGHVYGAWGDGNGWNNLPPKRSIGVTRIKGVPPDLSGDDLWGDGPGRGFAKPEALIGMGDTLYMFWTRIPENGPQVSATAVSHDYGKSWMHGDGDAFPYAPEGFRVRSICQFGPGYAGARDGYVYVYFAYNYAAELFLARVPREHLFDAQRYEWFTRLRDDGGAEWSRDFAARQPAFRDPGGFVWHIGVSYNAGLGRYLLTKPHFAADDDRGAQPMSKSGVASLGIFDAPTPWGPWTTVFRTDELKDGLFKFSYSIPPAYMSKDGRTFWLAWSGWPEYDSLRLVRGTFSVRTSAR